MLALYPSRPVCSNALLAGRDETVGEPAQSVETLGCHSVLELQLPLDRPGSDRSLRKGIQERVGLQILQARIPQPQRRLEPLERLGSIAPLRIDRGVLIGWGVAEGCRQFRKDSFRIGVPAELVMRSPRGTVGSCQWSGFVSHEARALLRSPSP